MTQPTKRGRRGARSLIAFAAAPGPLSPVGGVGAAFAVGGAGPLPALSPCPSSGASEPEVLRGGGAAAGALRRPLAAGGGCRLSQAAGLFPASGTGGVGGWRLRQTLQDSGEGLVIIASFRSDPATRHGLFPTASI